MSFSLAIPTKTIDASNTGESIRYPDLPDKLTYLTITLEQFNGSSEQMTGAQYEEMQQQLRSPFGPQLDEQQVEEQKKEGNTQLMRRHQYFGQMQQSRYFRQQHLLNFIPFQKL